MLKQNQQGRGKGRPVPHHMSVDKKLLTLVDNCNKNEIVGCFMPTSWEETVSEPVMDINWYGIAQAVTTMEENILSKLKQLRQRIAWKNKISQHLINTKNQNVFSQRSLGIERRDIQRQIKASSFYEDKLPLWLVQNLT